MTLRKRVGMASAAAVAVAVAMAAMVCYFVVRERLLSQVDGELTAQAAGVEHGYGLGRTFPGLAASAGGPAPYYQVVLPNGQAVANAGVALPQRTEAASVAAGTSSPRFIDTAVNGVRVRMFIFPVSFTFDGYTVVGVELARPLGPVENVLSDLRLVLFVVFLAGIALAAGLGRMAARRVLAPLAEVTATAQLIGETDDLSRRLAVHGDDEVGQLATRFNEMLERLASSRAALDDSVRSQRQLVADASHELRTPVTSLRTNIEVLLAGGELGDEDRRRLLDDVVEQSEELSTLVSDLIEVARGDLPSDVMDDTRLDRVAEESLARAHRYAPQVKFIADLHPTLVAGNAERLSRAINNLLDNAARHTGPSGPVELTVDADGVRVRDHGSGIDEEDLPYVFDRFYRGANSRARQGSGLGLAIVRQVAESHGGAVSAANAPDGGAVFTMRLPTAPVPPDASDDCGDGDGDGESYGAGGLATRA